jgi:hypothetical protein
MNKEKRGGGEEVKGKKIGKRKRGGKRKKR